MHLQRHNGVHVRRTTRGHSELAASADRVSQQDHHSQPWSACRRRGTPRAALGRRGARRRANPRFRTARPTTKRSDSLRTDEPLHCMRARAERHADTESARPLSAPVYAHHAVDAQPRPARAPPSQKPPQSARSESDVASSEPAITASIVRNAGIWISRVEVSEGCAYLRDDTVEAARPAEGTTS